MDKKILPIAIVFSSIGILMLIGASFYTVHQYTFVKKSQETIGQVIDINQYTGSDGNSFSPEIQYTVNNTEYTFESNYSASQPSYAVGDQVPVYYDPQNPDRAKLGTGLALYGASFIITSIGIVFALIGGLILLVYTKRKKEIAFLLNQGHRITSSITAIKQDMNYTFNNKHPYRIYTKIILSGQSMEKEYRSDVLWKNPETVTKPGDMINVYIDLSNPKRYYMDTRHLTQ